MNRLFSVRTLSLALGFIAAIVTSVEYAATQPRPLIVGLVFLGCVLFWFLIISWILSLLTWLQSELVLMGRWPRVQWRPTAFKSATLVARLIGLAAPFAVALPQEGYRVLLNPERWALVPVTYYASLALIAVPLWIVIKIGASRLRGPERGTVLLGVAVVMAILLVGGMGWIGPGRLENTARTPVDQSMPTTLPESPAPTTTPIPEATATPTATPLPTATATPLPVLPIRLRVPSIGVSAEVVHLGVKADGSMQAPDGPEVVAWYTFSARPGSPGNAVFAGHVDWHTGVTGVFWRLRELQPGDEVYIDGQDGREFVYAVASSTLYPANDAPVKDIIGPKPGECITLISCEGTFVRSEHDYDHRRVVVAERVR